MFIYYLLWIYTSMMERHWITFSFTLCLLVDPTCCNIYWSEDVFHIFFSKFSKIPENGSWQLQG